MKTTSTIGQCGGQISGRVLAAIVVLVVVIAVIVFAWRPEPEAEPEPAPLPGRQLESVAPAESKEERGDSAREIIATLEAQPGGVDYSQAYEDAREFQKAGRLADAQLLYFFAARGGHAPAAFDLATSYDPNHFSTGLSLMDKPDPFQAYKWYKAALEGGEAAAEKRLAELRNWAERAATSGNMQAEQLLVQWE